LNDHIDDDEIGMACSMNAYRLMVGRPRHVLVGDTEKDLEEI
jgi:hypothetical protein